MISASRPDLAPLYHILSGLSVAEVRFSLSRQPDRSRIEDQIPYVAFPGQQSSNAPAELQGRLFRRHSRSRAHLGRVRRRQRRDLRRRAGWPAAPTTIAWPGKLIRLSGHCGHYSPHQGGRIQ
jgi:hypothetical protein